MNEFSSARFFLTSLEIVLPDTKFSAEALVSSFGICRLVLPIGTKKNYARAKAIFEDFSADVVLVKQHTENGTSFSARFADLTDDQANYLQGRVAREGVPPSWIRRFPRILVSSLDEATNPHPNFCLIPWMGKEHKLRVVNFTVDGLRLFYEGELPGLRVGAPLTISVCTAAGTAISGVEAEVKNFCVLEDDGSQATTEIGLRFTESKSAARESYRSLIRDCVISLKGRKP